MVFCGWRLLGGNWANVPSNPRNSTTELGRQVRCIAVNSSADLSVSCGGEEKARDGYSTVFSTIPLACLQCIDTGSLQLDPIQEEAIRCLRYEDSTKVGIKCSYPWWIVECRLRGGGNASSTLPSRTCVCEDEDNDLLDLVLCDFAQQHRQHGITYKKLQNLYRGPDAFCRGNSPISILLCLSRQPMASSIE